MPAPVKEIRAGVYCKWLFSSATCAWRIAVFTIAPGTARNQQLVGAGQQGKLTLLLKDEE
ncbi:hypothetical protein DWS23_11190 [Escherichia coli]|nr:hypothetical protein C1192_02515 [Escherichia marmotae]EEV6992351.1 hypothetical protein [Escherichia coli]PSS40661.1 hypothetical protein BEM40_010075 [Escherichia sp. MOD1-EC5451]PSY63630.1 hypothetical protein C7B16_18520 [Escherichia sp. 20412-1]EFN9754179.1 hypothetical protein [Escherichia coli]